MDKLIKLGVEAKKNDTIIQNIETLCYGGYIDSGKALDLVVQQTQRFTKACREIINEGKISKKQFMLEQEMHGTNIN